MGVIPKMIKKKRAKRSLFFVRKFLKIRLKIHVNCGRIFRYFGAKYGADLIEFLIRIFTGEISKIISKNSKRKLWEERAKIKRYLCCKFCVFWSHARAQLASFFAYVSLQNYELVVPLFLVLFFKKKRTRDGIEGGGYTPPHK